MNIKHSSKVELFEGITKLNKLIKFSDEVIERDKDRGCWVLSLVMLHRLWSLRAYAETVKIRFKYQRHDILELMGRDLSVKSEKGKRAKVQVHQGLVDQYWSECASFCNKKKVSRIVAGS